MSYAQCDFLESVRIAGIDVNDIDAVQWAWGDVDSEGQCCEGCGGEWSGGFIFLMKDGRIGKVEGWCDYTGWGCQDGAEVTWHETAPEAPKGADTMPADLNGPQLAELIARGY